MSAQALARQVHEQLPHIMVHTVAAADLAQALALDVAHRLSHEINQTGHAVLALSGGKSPQAFFAALRVQGLDWSRVTVTLVDERCVPNTHADSNVRMLREHLLQDAAAQARLLPLLDQAQTPLAPLAELVRQAEHGLAALPAAAVTVLGMGPDGHTASLFPHTPELERGLDLANPAHCLSVSVPPSAPHAPYPRLSQTLSLILHARHLVLPLQGADKFQALAQALPARSLQWPISHVLHARSTPLALWLSE